MNRNKRLVSILAILMLFLALLHTTSAFDPSTLPTLPTLPAEFCGFVRLNGKPAPAGTEIVAKINDEVRGKIRIEEGGRYGSLGKFDEKLVVRGDDKDIDGNISFWVNGLKAEQTSKYEPGAFNFLNLTLSAVESFDTGKSEGPYPSISGTHYGTIIPNQNITVNRIYTYPCAGTAGHSEFVMIWNETTNESAVAVWNGSYDGDYHNLSFSPELTLREGVIYSYIIETGSYPQIIHAPYREVIGGNITCSKFVDVNGKVHHDWIPAIILWKKEQEQE